MSRVPLATGSALSGWINDRNNMNISRNALSCCVLRIVELTPVFIHIGAVVYWSFHTTSKEILCLIQPALLFFLKKQLTKWFLS
ncbi:hypothetical protein A7Y48_23865 [Salmonella enterica subsp. enterica serovar Enteritidis]|nr:hypothetical protein [Salmonella enterica subsp. enterica serovar Enteritidis]